MKYRLKKDLPGIKVGEIVYRITHFYSIQLSDHPDWFEPVQEFWVPGDIEEYWWIDPEGDISCSRTYTASCWRNALLAFGNCFRTKERAEEVAAKIKAMLLSERERI